MLNKDMAHISVLLVEDDKNFGDALIPRLEKKGLIVVRIGTGEEALEEIRKSKFEVVVSDIKLPGMDGVEFLKKVREIDKEIPVILLTGYASLESAREAIKLNAFDYLLKPLEGIDELVDPIYKAVYGYKLFLENHRLIEELQTRIIELEFLAKKSRSMEEELKRMIAELKLIFDSSKLGMMVIDKDFKVIRVNDAFLGMFHMNHDETIGKKCYDVCGGALCHTPSCHLEQIIHGGKGCIHEMDKTLGDRAQISCIVTAVGYKNVDGELIGAIERFEDISDRKKIEKSQRLSQLGELVASMAHEVNNPLQAIAGNLQLSMMEWEKGKDIKDRIKAAWDQIMQLREILQRVLAFSKLDKVEIEKTDINKVLELVVKLVEHQYSISNIAIKREYSDILPEIELDTKQMQQVFMNLIKNAAEAMPEGGTIIVSTSKNGEGIHISITDMGVGMSKDTLERIFDPFYTTKADGTGLGLAICYGIVKKHNGNLSYVSEIGKGTTATILLPLAGGSDEA